MGVGGGRRGRDRSSNCNFACSVVPGKGCEMNRRATLSAAGINRYQLEPIKYGE